MFYMSKKKSGRSRMARPLLLFGNRCFILCAACKNKAFILVKQKNASVCTEHKAQVALTSVRLLQ